METNFKVELPIDNITVTETNDWYIYVPLNDTTTICLPVNTCKYHYDMSFEIITDIDLPQPLYISFKTLTTLQNNLFPIYGKRTYLPK